MSAAALRICIADGVMMLSAIGCLLNTLYERRRDIVRRWRVLATGLLAVIPALILVAYPTPRNIGQVELWMVAALPLLAGGARGSFLAMFSDHKWGVIRLRRTYDGILVAAILVAFATLQTALEIKAGAEDHLLPTMEFLMTVVSTYLLGRAVTGWVRAGMIQHEDLFEPVL